MVENIYNILVIIWSSLSVIACICEIIQSDEVKVKVNIFELAVLFTSYTLQLITLILSIIRQDLWYYIIIDIIFLILTMCFIGYCIGSLLTSLISATDGKIAKGKNIDGGNIEEK